jgi:protein TonB
MPFGFNLRAETEGTAAEAVATPPTVAKQISPKYPTEALLLGIEGTVNVDLLVTAKGEVLAVGSVDNSTDARLTKAALAAVKQWKFANREAISTQPYLVKVPVNFKINGDAELIASR